MTRVYLGCALGQLLHQHLLVFGGLGHLVVELHLRDREV